jgi:transposase-like protein
MKNRTKFTQEKKAVLVQDFKNSGLSMAAWCRKQKIQYHTFNGWLRRASKEVNFAVITPTVETKECTSEIEIYFPNQTRLIIRNVSDIGKIVSVLIRS